MQATAPAISHSEVSRIMLQLLTIKRAATRLAVSPEFLKKLQRQGRLKIVRLGRAIRISEQELERLAREEFSK